MTRLEQIESQIERTDGVGEGTRRDGVHASGGHIVNGIECDATTCFEPQATGIECHGLFELGEVHVVEQNEIDAGQGEKVGELFQCGGLELHSHARVLGVDLVDGLLKPFQIAAGSQVIVFDHHRVVKAHAMVDAAAGEDGFFFDQPPAGRGFAGVPDFDGIRFDRLHVEIGHGGDAGQTLEKVQRGPFCGKNGAGAAFDFNEGIARLEALASGEGWPDAKTGVDLAEDRFGDAHAGDDSGLAGDDAAFAAIAVTDEVKGGDVSTADIFSDGGVNQGEGRAVHNLGRLLATSRGISSAEVSG